MGIDLAASALGACHVPVNELTWREVARVVILGTVLKDIGLGDVDVSASIRARGFYTSPETADKKILRLARKRILFNYTIRDENQESVYGEYSIVLLVTVAITIIIIVLLIIEDLLIG